MKFVTGGSSHFIVAGYVCRMASEKFSLFVSMYLMIVAKSLCNEMMNINIKVGSYEDELVVEVLEEVASTTSGATGSVNIC